MTRTSGPAIRLEAGQIVETIERLIERIEARFPGAGLADVARAVRGHAETSAAEAERLREPDVVVRVLVAAVLALGLAGVGMGAVKIDFHAESNNLFTMIQAVEALFNVALLVGAAVVFLVTIETRLRRKRALATLAPFRALVHVIDMHQLTKDPGMLARSGRQTAVSPKRDLDGFALSRYLDYCSELLSLTAKAAALTALAADDGVINAAVGEIEDLSTNLSQKIWQKIMILHSDGSLATEAADLPAGEGAAGLGSGDGYARMGAVGTTAQPRGAGAFD